MGFFSKPKTPDYAKIQAEAAAKEKAALAEREAQAKQSQLAAMNAAESRRKAFYSGIADTTEENQRKKFLKAV